MEEELTPRDLAYQAKKNLHSMGDPLKAQQGAKYFKEKVFLLGITASQLRKTSREFFLKITPYWSLNEALEFCELMLPDKYLEVKAFSILILEHYMKSLKKEHLFQIKSWINKNYCAAWATIDLLCPTLVSPLLELYPELISEIISWTGSKNRWLRRASAVSMVKLARKGKFLDDVYVIAEKLLADGDDLIQKANGWLLRESSKSNMDRVEQFVLVHRKKLSRTTLRCAVERFPEKKRKQILWRTRE